MKRSWHNQAGDTIVEVLIAIVLVAVILGGAYATANQSLLNTRAAQERGEALDIAQGQVESLRGFALAGTANAGAYTVFTEPDLFCITGATFVAAITPNGSNNFAVGTMPTISAQEATNPATVGYTGGCQQNFQSSGFFYDIAIDRCDSGDIGQPGITSCPYGAQPANSALFIVHVRWSSANSTSLDEVTLQYRLYESQPS
jgi:Tfp pilus assembly protein PilV